MVTVGYGDISPQTSLERFCSILTVLSACGVFAYSITEVGSIFQEMNEDQKKLKSNMFVINNYMKKKKITSDLQYQVRHYLEYYWHESLSENTMIEQNIINQLSNNLKENLIIEANRLLVLESPFFRDNFSLKTILKTVSIVSEQRCTPEEIIYLEGDIDDSSIYFIEKGSVRFFSATSQNDFETVSLNSLKHGDHFGKYKMNFRMIILFCSEGENCFLTGKQREQSMRSIEFTTLIKIDRSKFLEILNENPQDFEKFCLIRDDIALNQNYSRNQKYCSYCHIGNQISFKHREQECPLVNFIPNIQKLEDQFRLQPSILERKNQNRNKEKFNPRGRIEQAQGDSSKFLFNMRVLVNTYVEDYGLIDCTSQEGDEEDQNTHDKRLQTLETDNSFTDSLDNENSEKQGDGQSNANAVNRRNSQQQEVNNRQSFQLMSPQLKKIMAERQNLISLKQNFQNQNYPIEEEFSFQDSILSKNLIQNNPSVFEHEALETNENNESNNKFNNDYNKEYQSNNNNNEQQHHNQTFNQEESVDMIEISYQSEKNNDSIPFEIEVTENNKIKMKNIKNHNSHQLFSKSITTNDIQIQFKQKDLEIFNINDSINELKSIQLSKGKIKQEIQSSQSDEIDIQNQYHDQKSYPENEINKSDGIKQRTPDFKAKLSSNCNGSSNLNYDSIIPNIMKDSHNINSERKKQNSNTQLQVPSNKQIQINTKDTSDSQDNSQNNFIQNRLNRSKTDLAHQYNFIKRQSLPLNDFRKKSFLNQPLSKELHHLEQKGKYKSQGSLPEQIFNRRFDDNFDKRKSIKIKNDYGSQLIATQLDTLLQNFQKIQENFTMQYQNKNQMEEIRPEEMDDDKDMLEFDKMKMFEIYFPHNNYEVVIQSMQQRPLLNNQIKLWKLRRSAQDPKKSICSTISVVKNKQRQEGAAEVFNGVFQSNSLNRLKYIRNQKIKECSIIDLQPISILFEGSESPYSPQKTQNDKTLKFKNDEDISLNPQPTTKSQKLKRVYTVELQVPGTDHKVIIPNYFGIGDKEENLNTQPLAAKSRFFNKRSAFQKAAEDENERDSDQSQSEHSLHSQQKELSS